MRLPFILAKAIGRFSARSTKMEFALLDLPDELIVHIIGHIEDPKTLANLACTSRQMYDLAIPPLYREILIANPKDVQALDLALKRRPQWASAVQKLEVPSNPGLSPHLATISGLITKMTNLRHLLIESPMVNCGVGENFEGNEKEWNAVADPLIAPFSLSSMIRRTEPSVKCLQNLKSCEYMLPLLKSLKFPRRECLIAATMSF